MNLSRHQPKGFTLVELISVILIISILALLILAGSRSVVSQYRQVGCVNNLKAIGTAISSYMLEHQGNVPAPYVGIKRSPLPSDPPEDERIWTMAFLKYGYIGSEEAFYCPDGHPKGYQNALEVTANNGSTNARRALMRTYGMRQWWFGNDFIAQSSDPKKATLIEAPSQFYIVADSYWDEWGTGGYNLQPGAQVQKIDLRHKKKANLLFLDGHVAAHGDDYFATLHHLEREGIYSGGDRSKDRAGFIHYTRSETP